MPILKAIGKNKDKKKGSTRQTLAGMKAVLNYIARAGREEQIYKAFGMGLSDNVDKANDKIIFNKKTHDKVDSNLYKHFALSFPPGFDNLELIEKITREFVQKEYVDKGFLCYVGIHIDKDHYHSHILVDTVNFNTGYKLHQLDNADMKKARYKDKILPEQEISLEHLKNSMEEIAMSYGVESPERKKEKNKSINIGTMSKYKGVTKENSWRTKIAKNFEDIVLNLNTTIENLQDKLKEKGIFFNRFNKEKRTLTLGTMYEDKGKTKKGLVKISTLEQEEDYRFQATKNIYNWDNLWEELDKHKVKLLEQEQEKEKTNENNLELDLDIFDEIEKEIKLELEKEKELTKSKTKTYTLEEERQIDENTRIWIENFNKKQEIEKEKNKSVEKKEEEKPVELNAIEKAKISQQLAEEQRLKELEAEKLAKKKKKATEWIDEKDQWVDEKDEWVSEWEDDKNDWDLSK